MMGGTMMRGMGLIGLLVIIVLVLVLVLLRAARAGQRAPATHCLLLYERPCHSDKGAVQQSGSATGRPAGQLPPHHWPLSASRSLGRAAVRESQFPRAADDTN